MNSLTRIEDSISFGEDWKVDDVCITKIQRLVKGEWKKVPLSAVPKKAPRNLRIALNLPINAEHKRLMDLIDMHDSDSELEDSDSRDKIHQRKYRPTFQTESEPEKQMRKRLHQPQFTPFNFIDEEDDYVISDDEIVPRRRLRRIKAKRKKQLKQQQEVSNTPLKQREEVSNTQLKQREDNVWAQYRSIII